MKVASDNSKAPLSAQPTPPAAAPHSGSANPQEPPAPPAVSHDAPAHFNNTHTARPYGHSVPPSKPAAPTMQSIHPAMPSTPPATGYNMPPRERGTNKPAQENLADWLDTPITVPERKSSAARHETQSSRDTAGLDFMSYNVVPAQSSVDTTPVMPKHALDITHIMPKHTADIPPFVAPARPKPILPTPPINTDHMDYNFYPGQTAEPSPNKPKPHNQNNTESMDYPIFPDILKPIEPPPKVTVDTNFIRHHTHPTAPQSYDSAPGNSIDFSDYQVLPATHEPAIPQFQTSNVGIPITAPYTDSTNASPHMPVPQAQQPIGISPPVPVPYYDQAAAASPSMPSLHPRYTREDSPPSPYIEPVIHPAPASTVAESPEEFDSQQEQWLMYEESDDMVTHMPRNKTKLPIIIGAVAFLIIAAAVATFLFLRSGNVNPEQIVGTWEPPITLGTWISRYEFRADGTGRSYDFNTGLNVVRDEVYFSWEIVDGNRIRNTLWIEMAEIRVQRRTTPPIFRYRFESSDEWHALEQVIGQQ